MKKIIKLTESDLVRIVKKVLKEESSDMMSFEKVVDIPNTNKDDLFNKLKGNRELMRSGTLRSEIQGQQLDIQKSVNVDKSMYSLIGKNPFSPNGCYNGKLTFDVLVIIKDNKFKIVCDNFVWTNPGTKCSIISSLDPITKTRPKGMTISQYWDNFSEMLPKYCENLFNQVSSTLSNTQSDF